MLIYGPGMKFKNSLETFENMFELVRFGCRSNLTLNPVNEQTLKLKLVRGLSCRTTLRDAKINLQSTKLNYFKQKQNYPRGKHAFKKCSCVRPNL